MAAAVAEAEVPEYRRDINAFYQCVASMRRAPVPLLPLASLLPTLLATAHPPCAPFPNRMAKYPLVAQSDCTADVKQEVTDVCVTAVVSLLLARASRCVVVLPLPPPTYPAMIRGPYSCQAGAARSGYGEVHAGKWRRDGRSAQ